MADTDPKTRPIPLFFPKPNPLSRSTSAKSSDSIPEDLLFSGLRAERRCLSNPLPSKNSSCPCSQILVADDDTFQHLYYSSLFRKNTPSGSSTAIEKQKWSVDLSFCGEQLLEKYIKTSECECRQLKLIVVDYQMGKDKLNGIEVCVKLRRMGYRGPLVLRTSEPEEFLRERHKEMEEGILTMLVSKNDIEGGKKIVEEFLLERKRE